MATVVFSDVLCFLNKSIKRFDKETLLETIAKFYHEDELYNAKLELCKVVSTLLSTADSASTEATPTIAGWSKLVNNKGAPIARKAGDPGQRRHSEADDLLQMLLLLDVHKVELPRFVAEDIDRIPGAVMIVDGAAKSSSATSVAEITKLVSAMSDMLCKFMSTMEDVVKRLERAEQQSGIVSSAALGTILQRLDGLERKILSAAPADVTPSGSSQSASDPSKSSVGTGADAAAAGASKSWADQAQDLAKADPATVFIKPMVNKAAVRVRGNATLSDIKAVPRQLTCFVGRLDSDITGELLTEFLHGQGILDAQCRKLVPKDGRVFRTSAFRVSCSEEYRDILYDESQWPMGAELRDWVFYKNGGQ